MHISTAVIPIYQTMANLNHVKWVYFFSYEWQVEEVLHFLS